MTFESGLLPWIAFLAFVLVMLGLDLGVFHRKAHEIRFREALTWSIVWVMLAAAFGGAIAWRDGSERATEFFTGYVIEKALSVDNIFIFLVIFSSFSIPSALQHRVLFWGILGALVMRAAFVAAGAQLLESFHWTLYFFGGLLVLTGAKLLVQRNQEMHPERHPLVRWLCRSLPMTQDLRGQRFLVREGGRWLATPLLVVLIIVEATDVVFAVDSIPAIFAVTRDPFIVFTSNVFAILGLRSMYFLLAGSMHKFRYLKVGLAAILVFVGIKMLASDAVKVSPGVSLAVVFSILAAAITASWIRASREDRAISALPRTQPGAVGSLPRGA